MDNNQELIYYVSNGVVIIASLLGIIAISCIFDD